MSLTDSAKNAMLNALAADALYVSLHTADPGSTGTNEVSGGSPAYARKSVTWASAASGAIAASNTPTLDVPGSTTVGWGGLWSAATAGTFYGGFPLGAPGQPEIFTADPSTDTFTSPAHGLANNDTVVVIDTLGTIPSGVSEGTIYYVVSSATDTFQLSATSGGAAVNLTVAGVGLVQKLVTETFNGQGTYTLSAVDLTFD